MKKAKRHKTNKPGFCADRGGDRGALWRDSPLLRRDHLRQPQRFRDAGHASTAWMASPYGFGLPRNSELCGLSVPTGKFRPAIQEQSFAIHSPLVTVGGTYRRGHCGPYPDLRGGSAHRSLQPLGVLTYASGPVRLFGGLRARLIPQLGGVIGVSCFFVRGMTPAREFGASGAASIVLRSNSAAPIRWLSAV